MDSKHTPEPWSVQHGYKHAGKHACVINLHHLIAVTYVKPADAYRIVACVNACAGMDDPAAQLEQLRAENARLREALEGIMEYEPEHCPCGDDGCTQTRERYDAARAALRGGRRKAQPVP